MERSDAQLRTPDQLLKNEEGVAIIAVALILVVLTIIGIATTNVSNTEVTISGNQSVYQRTFYQAEGATIEAIDKLEFEANPDASTAAWLENDLNQITLSEIEDASFWTDGANGTKPEPSSSWPDDAKFVVVSEGIISGSSLGVSSSKVHEYAVYGRSTSAKGGTTVVNIGYLMAF
jgi:Tfp pilus assembly protein PilX